MTRSIAPIFLVFILTVLTSPQGASASAEIGSDFTFAGLNFNDIGFRTRTYLLIGTRNFSFGPVVYAERPHSYNTDLLVGPGIRIGSEFQLLLDAGFFFRQFDGLIGRGFGFGLGFGIQITKAFRVLIPITTKVIRNGDLPKRWMIDYMPYLGLRAEL